MTAAPRRGAKTKTNAPRTTMTTSAGPTMTTAKARYALMRQALEAARGKPAEPADGETRLLDFLKSS